ncbi:MAG: FAD-dependent oxidoreductase [Deltaproteobacteria bacterium]|nr:FAD-dependent oxidoreductase [Deltaproteobacteria bacterium]
MTNTMRAAASRRTFLKAVGGVLGAATLPIGATLARGEREATEPDVVVIGGGFAGVTAARELGHAGLRVLLLEARNRLGGRTLTTKVGEEIFELGGTWIHSTQPHVWAEANRYGLELVETPDGFPERIVWWDGEQTKEAGILDALPLVGSALCASPDDVVPEMPLPVLHAFALLDQVMSKFHAEAATAFPRPFDPFFSDAWQASDRLSIRDRLDSMGLSASRRALLEGVLGASAHGAFEEAGLADMLRWWALSGSDLQRYSDTVARFRFRQGTSRLIDAMIADGKPDVRLQSPVTRVVQTGGRVEVTIAGGETFRARAVIAALPMNVLANIDFSPALDPAKIAASKERHAGAGVKAYIRVRGEVPRLLALAPEPEPFSTLMTAHGGKDGGVLIGFGTDPKKIDIHATGAVQQAVRRFLPAAEVTEVFAYDWHLDPYSLGTWCILRKGQMTKYFAALRAPEGLVHFAGGDFALGFRGFIDGAIESGTRTARVVIERLAGSLALGAEAETAPAATAGAPGEAAFEPCAVCHSVDESGKAGIGPNLHGVVGRKAASDPSFAYSEALRSRGITWTEKDLDAFLADPQAFIPGTQMPFTGLKDPADRAAVIRFLLSAK